MLVLARDCQTLGTCLRQDPALQNPTSYLMVTVQHNVLVLFSACADISLLMQMRCTCILCTNIFLYPQVRH